MGWTGIAKPKNVKKFLTDEFTDSMYEVTDIAIVNVKEAYIALKSKQSGDVFALVVLLNYQGDEMLFKDMSENMEPYYYNCPERILNKLSDTTNKGSLRWREKCRNVLEKKSLIKNLKTGDWIKLSKPLTFQGGDVLDTFQIYRQGRRIIFVNGWDRYSIPNLARYDFEVIAECASV